MSAHGGGGSNCGGGAYNKSAGSGSGGLKYPHRFANSLQLQDSFERFVESMEDAMEIAGVGKVSTPKSWAPTTRAYERLDVTIPSPIRQHITGRAGFYRTLLVEKPTMSLLRDFKPIAASEERVPNARETNDRAAAPASASASASASSADVNQETPEEAAAERAFWKSITRAPALYGADVEGSLFDVHKPGWNLRRLDTLLSRTLAREDVHIPGVMSPYLYFGTWRSVFAYHTEDFDLYSVNYLHTGAPKTWYFIPPSAKERFEQLCMGFAPDLFKECKQFLRHKEIIVSPQLLKNHNIPYVKVIQRPGDFIFTFPGAYHCGFNHGFNIAESTNFATRRWVKYGCRARPCECVADSVRINMRLFENSCCTKRKRDDDDDDDDE